MGFLVLKYNRLNPGVHAIYVQEFAHTYFIVRPGENRGAGF